MKQSIKSQTFVAKRKKWKFEKNEILLYQNTIWYYVMFDVELSLLGIRCMRLKLLSRFNQVVVLRILCDKIPTSFILPSEETFNWNLCHIPNCPYHVGLHYALDGRFVDVQYWQQNRFLCLQTFLTHQTSNSYMNIFKQGKTEVTVIVSTECYIF